MFLGLRGRLILLVCFATVPALTFIFFAAAKERQTALERMETEARHLGNLAAREHANQIGGAKSLLRRLTDVAKCAPVESSAPVCAAYLPPLLAGFPQFANIGVADTRGEVACSAAPIQRGASMKDNVAFERALGSKDVEIGSYVVGFVGRPVLHLALVVPGASGPACGVAFVAVELGWLDQLAKQANLPSDYSLLITDRSGVVLARSGEGADQVGRADPALAAALGRPHGAVIELGGAATQYVVATPMESIDGVFVVVGLPYTRMQSAASWAFYRTLLGLVLVTIFAIASAIVAAEISVLRALRSLTVAVRRFGDGDLSARAPLPGTYGELHELSVSFGVMAENLATRQREALTVQEQLRALTRRLQTVRDEEAKRIARGLHDELGQILTGLKLDLARSRRVSAGDGDEEAIARMSEQIDQAIDAVRRISADLRPPVLDRLGLGAGIDWLAREYEAKSGLSIVPHISDLREPIDGRVSIAIFRVVQEALTNVVRHARASSVTIDVVGHDDSLTVTIRDDGEGIPPAADGPLSLGILGMRERVSLLGGTLHVRGEPGAGTTISVDVPREPAVTEEP